MPAKSSSKENTRTILEFMGKGEEFFMVVGLKDKNQKNMH
jgi:hypothetical protein